MDTRARWNAHVAKTTAQKLDSRRRQAQRFRAAEAVFYALRAEREMGVALAWRRWSMDVEE